MEAISQIGNPNGRTTSESATAGKNLESYRRHPTEKVKATVGRVQNAQTTQNTQSTRATQAPSLSFFGDVLQDIADRTARTEQNNFFRSDSRCSNCDEADERNSSGSLLNKTRQDSNLAITSGQSDAALGKANGVFSPNFVEANPAFSPPPRELSELPLSDVKANSGELSQDLLQALATLSHRCRDTRLDYILVY